MLLLLLLVELPAMRLLILLALLLLMPLLVALLRLARPPVVTQTLMSRPAVIQQQHMITHCQHVISTWPPCNPYMASIGSAQHHTTK